MLPQEHDTFEKGEYCELLNKCHSLKTHLFLIYPQD